MSDSLYLRPLGLLYGAAATAAVEGGHAGWLAGGPVAFSALEVIEGEAGDATRSFSPFAKLAASPEPEITETLDWIVSPRPDIAGLSLDTTRIMGVVNVTPDSFSDGGLYDTSEAAIAHGARLAKDGADILDIGGESTRPGSDPVEAAHEVERIVPVIEGLVGVKAKISADTRKAVVMEKAASAGAHILNDVSALTHDPRSLAVAAKSGLSVILMHAQGDPKTMQDDPTYADVLLDVYDYLEGRIAACEAEGVSRDRLIVDPGIGFGKTLEHNLALLDGLALFHGLGVPLLLGASRKRFIGTLAGEPDASKRVPGSIAGALAGVARGVQIVRVHDVAETRQALVIWNAVNG